jgi:hypothetical protein
LAKTPLTVSVVLSFALVYFVWVASRDIAETMATLVVSHSSLSEALIGTPPLLEQVDILPFNDIYRIPESHPQVGDRSSEYVRLRKEYDARLFLSVIRSLKVVKELGETHPTNYSARAMTGTSSATSYDIYNCPDIPPPGYPFAWPMVDMLSSWPPRDTSQPPERALHQGVCVFSILVIWPGPKTTKTENCPLS